MQVGNALGFERVTVKRREAIQRAMKTAVRRGIVVNARGVYSIDCKHITDYPDDLLEKYFCAAIGRVWWRREDAIRAAALYLGFKRTGSAIVKAFEGVIRRGARRRELEQEGGMVRRSM